MLVRKDGVSAESRQDNITEHFLHVFVGVRMLRYVTLIVRSIYYLDRLVFNWFWHPPAPAPAHLDQLQ